jgi:hypothetical protein
VNVEDGQRHAWYPSEAAPHKTGQNISVGIGKLFENDQPHTKRASMPDDSSSQKLGAGQAGGFTPIVQVRLACDASDHHGLHEQKSGPLPPDEIQEMPDVRARSLKDVLVQNKERLDSANSPLGVLQCEIQTSKFRVKGVGHYFIIAMIFVL